MYDQKTGQRMNTRDLRARDQYNRERSYIIEELIKLDPTFIVNYSLTNKNMLTKHALLSVLLLGSS